MLAALFGEESNAAPLSLPEQVLASAAGPAHDPVRIPIVAALLELSAVT